MRSITTFDIQYAHRFYKFKGEAQYLHGHTGILTIEVEDTVNPGVNMVFPCNEIRKTAWDVIRNFDHALILREDDPLLPAILGVYEQQGIKNGAPTNQMKGPAFKTELATAYNNIGFFFFGNNVFFGNRVDDMILPHDPGFEIGVQPVKKGDGLCRVLKHGKFTP